MIWMHAPIKAIIPGGAPLYPFRTPHIPFVSEIIRGQVENRCILVRRVVPWICHGAAHHGVMGHFMGFDAAGICIYGECHG